MAPEDSLARTVTTGEAQASRAAFRRRVVAGTFRDYADLSEALDDLQFVQADPIRAPARAQDLMLRQRVAGYRAGDLEAAFGGLEAEEGYLFAYGFMTPEVWRHLRWRDIGRMKRLEREVLAAVAEMGDVHPRDLDARFARRAVTNAWGGKSQETKRVLERLHHHGYLRVCRRESGIRVYRVPGHEDGRALAPAARYRHLLRTTAAVFGPTTERFLLAELRSQNHLQPDRSDRRRAIEGLVAEGALSRVEVDGVSYLWAPERWASDEVPDRVRILAPFDPLVRDRERFAQLWGWTYTFEAYVPEKKRVRGYYAMPVLWRDDVIGWANARVTEGVLDVAVGYARSAPRTKVYRRALEREVAALARCLGLGRGAWRLEA